MDFIQKINRASLVREGFEVLQRSQNSTVAALIVGLLLARSVWADIENPARKIADVTAFSAVTKVKAVKTAKIVAADYALIKKDFPELAGKSEAEINNWLLQSAGKIAIAQAEQTVVNTPIEVDGAETLADRPPDYRRALVFTVAKGLIDGKGFGSAAPSQKDHSNGLATLGEMIREYLYQKLVQRIFDHEGSGLRTVGSYAVIDWGFRVKHADGSTSPAGAILRQAHKRAPGEVSLLDKEKSLAVELVLRKFGVTSAGAHRNEPKDLLNVQGTADGAIIDFGAFLAVKGFSKAVAPYHGFEVILTPDSDKFVQPDGEIRVPFEIWGTVDAGVEDPKQDGPWRKAHDLAEKLANGQADQKRVTEFISTMLLPFEQRLNAREPKACPLIFIKAQ